MDKTIPESVNPTATDILHRLAIAGLKPPKTVTLSVTNRCNLSCRHCWPDSGPNGKGQMVSRDRVIPLIQSFTILGVEKIILTGGEPLIHPDWFDILSFACTQSGISEVRLQTNATLITQAHIEAFLSLTGQGLIFQTSLEGATPATHDWVRGAGSFHQTMKGLRLLKKNGMAHRICITFTEMLHNFEDIPDLLKIADEMGVGQFITGTLVLGGRAAYSSDIGLPEPHQYENLLERYQLDQTFKDQYRRIGNIAALEWYLDTADTTATTCCTFIETPYVTANGHLYPCTMLQADDYSATDVFDRPLNAVILEKIDTWSRLREISQSRLTHLDTCRNCVYYKGCGAGCIGRAYAANGDFFSAEDRCHLRKAVYCRRSH